MKMSNKESDITFGDVIASNIKSFAVQIATKFNTARRAIYMTLNKGNRDIALSESITIKAETHDDLRRFNAMVEIMRRQRGRFSTTDRTISQINSVLFYVDTHQACYRLGTAESIAFFLEHIVNVTYVIDNRREMKVWIEVIAKDKLETKRAFFVQGLEDPHLAETISIAF